MQMLPEREKMSAILHRPVLAVAILATAFLAGCASKNTGSRTIVGSHTTLPELSDSSDSVSLRIYDAVEGAKVWTAKDCNVRIAYTNDYTKKYFGILESRGHMMLNVKIEPCDMSQPAADQEVRK